MVDSRFSRQISPSALLENYKSAGENVENIKAMSWAIGQVDWILFCMSHDRALGSTIKVDFNFSKASFCRRSPSELTQSTCDKSRFIKKTLLKWHDIIANVRYNKLLTWLQGFRDIPIKAIY